MLHQILDVDVCQSVQLLLVLSVVRTLTPKKHILTPLFSSLDKLLCSQEIYRPEIPNSLYEVNELKCNSINVFSCTSCLRSPPLYTPPSVARSKHTSLSSSRPPLKATSPDGAAFSIVYPSPLSLPN